MTPCQDIRKTSLNGLFNDFKGGCNFRKITVSLFGHNLLGTSRGIYLKEGRMKKTILLAAAFALFLSNASFAGANDSKAGSAANKAPAAADTNTSAGVAANTDTTLAKATSTDGKGAGKKGGKKKHRKPKK